MHEKKSESKTRAPKGQGSVFERKLPDGRSSWGYVIDLGTVNSRRRRLFKRGFATKTKAGRALRNKLNEHDRGKVVAPDRQSFAAFVERWFDEFAARTCTPKTIERYRELWAYAEPDLGPIRLQELSALMIEPVLFQLQKSGGKDRKTKQARPLSAKTVRHIAGVLSVVLKKAVKLKLRESNPMQAVELPAAEAREAKALDDEQMDLYLKESRAAGLYEILMFASGTGARRGEVLAIAWPDLDLDARTAKISKSLEQTRKGLRVKTTKNKRTRVITLPASLVELLRFLRERQQENSRLFGADYRTDLDLVFAAPNGEYLKPNSITAKACLIAKKAGFKNIGIHSLRHSHGSQMLSKGVPLTTVSKRLGHSNPYTTATIYAHAMPKDDAAAAEIWDREFGRRSERANLSKPS